MLFIIVIIKINKAWMVRLFNIKRYIVFISFNKLFDCVNYWVKMLLSVYLIWKILVVKLLDKYKSRKKGNMLYL